MFLFVTHIVAISLVQYSFAYQSGTFLHVREGIVKPHTELWRTRLQMTRSSTPWSTQTLSSLQRGSRKESIEYLESFGTESQFASLADAIGLNISNGEAERSIIPHHLTSSSDLFCNREINMDQLEAVGFDMDWTLARYNEDFDLLAYNGAKQKLVSLYGYPEEVLLLEYSQKLCVVVGV